MNLTFDNLSELNEFLQWADLYRAPGGREPDVAPTGGVSGGVGDIAFDTPQRPLSADHVSISAALNDADRQAIATARVVAGTLSSDKATAQPSEPVNAVGKPARKRRTKAEIEADETAAEAAQAAQRDAAGTTTPNATAQPQGANPFEQPATPAADPDSAPEGHVDGGAEGAETVVTPFQHLTRAREFIAKHGMPKYNESFAKAGLDANVMGYSAFQRALHMTALDELDKG